MADRTFTSFLFRFLRNLLVILLGVTLLVAIIVGFLGLTATGNQFLANQLAKRISTPNQQVRITGVDGLLQGALHVDDISLSDKAGTYAVAKDVTLVWQPEALFRGLFHAERLAIGKVSFMRIPQASDKNTGQTGAFQLPIEIQVDDIDFARLELAKAVVRRDTTLKIKGKASAKSNQVSAIAAASELARPDAKATLKLDYNLATNSFDFDTLIDEPKGGMLASLMRIPETPTMAVSIRGGGTFDNLEGAIGVTINEVQTVNLNGTLKKDAERTYSLLMKGNGNLEKVAPRDLQPLLSGNTDLNIDARFTADGLLDVKDAHIVNETFALSGNGTIDPKGSADFKAQLARITDDIPFNWPPVDPKFRTKIRTVDLQMTGPSRKAIVTLQADLASTEFPGGIASDLVMEVRSPAFDLVSRTGTLDARVNAGSITYSDPNIARLVSGGVSVVSTVAVEPNSIGFSDARVTAGAVTVTANGAVDLSSATVLANVAAEIADPAALVPALSPYQLGAISVAGNLKYKDISNLSVENLNLVSPKVNVQGNAQVANGVLKGRLNSEIAQLASLVPGIKGKGNLSIELLGSVQKPDFNVTFNSPELITNNQSIKAVTAHFDGTQLGGKLDLAANYSGLPISLNTNVDLGNDIVSLKDVSVKAGANTVAGNFAFDQAFRPSGQADLNLVDIGELAKIFGVDASGALTGKAVISSADNDPFLTLNANLANASAVGVQLPEAVITGKLLSIDDINFTAELTAGKAIYAGTEIEKLGLQLSGDPKEIAFAGAGEVEKQPVSIYGDVNLSSATPVIHIKTLTSDVKNLPVRLTAPTEVSIAGGVANIAPTRLDLAGGTLVIDGSAGDMLQLNIGLERIPADIANRFVKDQDIKGTLSGTAKVTGSSGAPKIEFSATLAGASARALEAQALDPLDIALKGTFEGQTLRVEANTKVKTEPANAKATITLNGNNISVPEIAIQIGSANASGGLDYAQSRLQGKLNFDVPDANALAALLGRKAEGSLKGTLDLNTDGETLQANLAGTGSVRGQPVELKGRVERRNETLTVPDFSVVVGTNTIGGKLTLEQNKLSSGALTFDLPDLKLLGAMLGQQAEGALKGTADLARKDGKLTASVSSKGLLRGQDIDITADAVVDKQIALPKLDVKIGDNTINGNLILTDQFLPIGNVQFELPDIGLIAALVGQKVEGAASGNLEIKAADDLLSGTLSANISRLKGLGANVANASGTFTIRDLLKGEIEGKLNADAIAYNENKFDGLELKVSRKGDSTNFDLKGTYDGAPLETTGSIGSKSGKLDVALNSFTARPKGIPVKLQSPITISTTSGGAKFSGVSVAAGTGTVTVSGNASANKLDITAKLDNLPASLANNFAKTLDANGTVSGRVTVKGTASAPDAAFDLAWRNAEVAQTRSAGISSLAITAKGRFKDGKLTVDTSGNGGGGVAFSSFGSVGIQSNKLAIKVDGSLPFSAIAAPLAAQGVNLTGTAKANLEISGTTSAPSIRGTVSTSGATLVVIRQNVTINSIAANVSLDGQQARIERLSGKFAGGGTVNVSGTVGIAAGSNYPADLSIQLKDAVYTDTRVVAAKVSGDLKLSGPLTGGALLSGKIRVARADITVPERLPGSLGKLNIRHVNAPAAISEQYKAIHKGKRDNNGAANAENTGMRLDLTLSAPRRVFVRGRGLDAELGGDIHVVGSMAAPQATGGFKMRRGRLSIIGRRLDFTSGNIGFTGALTPTLDLVAQSDLGSITANVTVAGPATDPKVAFTSTPSLPQDEILAQLIFGRSASNLSAIQIAQLADAVATLAGGQSSSLFDKLRQGLGVDDLDIGTDENGNTNVSIGKYINRRTYFQLQQGSGAGSAKAIINLDVGKGVKLRGSAGADGAGGGVFFEREY